MSIPFGTVSYHLIHLIIDNAGRGWTIVQQECASGGSSKELAWIMKLTHEPYLMGTVGDSANGPKRKYCVAEHQQTRISFGIRWLNAARMIKRVRMIAECVDQSEARWMTRHRNGRGLRRNTVEWGMNVSFLLFIRDRDTRPLASHLARLSGDASSQSQAGPRMTSGTGAH